MKDRKVKGVFFKALVIGLGVLSLGIIISIFLYIFYKAMPVLSLSFFLEKPRGFPLGSEGGVGPAITGTLALGVLSQLISSVFGIGTGLYLAFYKARPRINSVVEFFNQVLSGISSIMYGLVTYSVFVFALAWSRSLLVAAISIGALTLPFTSLRARKLFDERGKEYLIQALNLGLSKEYSIRKIILPYLWPDLVGIVLLSMAYGMGAVAPIMYTGAVIVAGHPKSIFEPFMSLPYHLYMFVMNGFGIETAYGTAAVLLILLLTIQVIVRFLTEIGRRKDRDD